MATEIGSERMLWGFDAVSTLVDIDRKHGRRIAQIDFRLAHVTNSKIIQRPTLGNVRDLDRGLLV